MSWLYLKYTSFEAWKNLCVNVKIKSREKSPTVDLSNRTIIVTGATSGIGRETAIKLADAGAHLILACRNVDAAEQVKNEILDRVKNGKGQAAEQIQVKVYKLQVDNYDSIRSFVTQVKQSEPVIDVLINNAGAICHEAVDGVSPHQMSLRTNYFGHVMLSMLLLDFMMTTSKSPRIVNLGTIGHMNIQDMDLELLTSKSIDRPLLSYAFAKAALLMFTKELSTRVSPKVRVLAADPGVSLTPGYRTMFTVPIAKWISEGAMLAPFRRSVSEAADSVVFAVVDESAGAPVYLMDGNPQVMSPICLDGNVRAAVWKKTLEILDLPVMDSSWT